MALSGVVLAVLLAPGGGGTVALGQRIAVLEIDGVISDDRQLLDDLRNFRRDRSVRGFVISINSPGGVVAPSQSIYDALRELRESDERPVIASIRWVGASGGYYVALGADSIFAMPGSTKACTTAWENIIAPQLDARTRPCNLANLRPRLKE